MERSSYNLKPHPNEKSPTIARIEQRIADCNSAFAKGEIKKSLDLWEEACTIMFESNTKTNHSLIDPTYLPVANIWKCLSYNIGQIYLSLSKNDIQKAAKFINNLPKDIQPHLIPEDKDRITDCLLAIINKSIQLTDDALHNRDIGKAKDNIEFTKTFIAEWETLCDPSLFQDSHQIIKAQWDRLNALKKTTAVTITKPIHLGEHNMVTPPPRLKSTHQSPLTSGGGNEPFANADFVNRRLQTIRNEITEKKMPPQTYEQHIRFLTSIPDRLQKITDETQKTTINSSALQLKEELEKLLYTLTNPRPNPSPSSHAAPSEDPLSPPALTTAAPHNRQQQIIEDMDQLIETSNQAFSKGDTENAVIAFYKALTLSNSWNQRNPTQIINKAHDIEIVNHLMESIHQSELALQSNNIIAATVCMNNIKDIVPHLMAIGFVEFNKRIATQLHTITQKSITLSDEALKEGNVEQAKERIRFTRTFIASWDKISSSSKQTHQSIVTQLIKLREMLIRKELQEGIAIEKIKRKYQEIKISINTMCVEKLLSRPDFSSIDRLIKEAEQKVHASARLVTVTNIEDIDMAPKKESVEKTISLQLNLMKKNTNPKTTKQFYDKALSLANQWDAAHPTDLISTTLRCQIIMPETVTRTTSPLHRDRVAKRPHLANSQSETTTTATTTATIGHPVTTEAPASTIAASTISRATPNSTTAAPIKPSTTPQRIPATPVGSAAASISSTTTSSTTTPASTIVLSTTSTTQEHTVPTPPAVLPPTLFIDTSTPSKPLPAKPANNSPASSASLSPSPKAVELSSQGAPTHNIPLTAAARPTNKLQQAIDELKTLMTQTGKHQAAAKDVGLFIEAIQKSADEKRKNKTQYRQDLTDLVTQTTHYLRKEPKTSAKTYIAAASQWNNKHPSKANKIIATIMFAITAALIVAAVFIAPVLSAPIALLLSPVAANALAGATFALPAAATLFTSGLFAVRKNNIARNMLSIEKRNEEANRITSPVM